MPRARIRTLKDGTQISNVIGVFFERTISFEHYPIVIRLGGKKALLLDCYGKHIIEDLYWTVKAIECEIIKEVETLREHIKSLNQS